MHGALFLELERYLTQKLGRQHWEQAKRAAGVANRIYVQVDAYPDVEFDALLKASAELLQKPPRFVLEDFGIFVAPQLLKTYRFLVKNEWKLLDVLANVELVMHAAVRRRTPLAEPPRLRIARPRPNEVLIVYDSPRKMCEFARGLIEGLAQFFEEPVRISEQTCMHERADACRIVVTRR